MPNVDERIRQEMQQLGRHVDLDGVLERVARRRGRRRVVRRIQAATLAVVVVGGSVAGGFGLTRLFAHPATTGPATQGSPTGPNPTSAGGSPQPTGEEILCDETQLNADVDGDGTPDQVALYSPGVGSCNSPDVGKQWVLHVSGGKLATSTPGVDFYGLDQDLSSDCTVPGECRLFAAPDINGDGQAELAIEYGTDENSGYFGLYELDGVGTAGGPRFVRIEVVDPGDPDSGLTGGTATFRWGGSPYQRLVGEECRGDGADRILVVSTAVAIDAAGTRYEVHEGQLQFRDGKLHVVATADYPNLEPDQNLPFVLPTTLCGSPLVKT